MKDYHKPNHVSLMDEKKKSQPGRKPKSDPAVFRYGIKLNSAENARFEQLFAESEIKEKARFIKSMLFSKEMKVVKIDKAAMDYYIRLTEFHRQFQAIGNNYNQTVRAIHTNFGEKRALVLLYKLEKTTIELVVLSKKIIELTRQYEEEWLRK